MLKSVDIFDGLKFLEIKAENYTVKDTGYLYNLKVSLASFESTLLALLNEAKNYGAAYSQSAVTERQEDLRSMVDSLKLESSVKEKILDDIINTPIKTRMDLFSYLSKHGYIDKKYSFEYADYFLNQIKELNSQLDSIETLVAQITPPINFIDEFISTAKNLFEKYKDIKEKSELIALLSQLYDVTQLTNKAAKEAKIFTKNYEKSLENDADEEGVEEDVVTSEYKTLFNASDSIAKVKMSLATISDDLTAQLESDNKILLDTEYVKRFTPKYKDVLLNQLDKLLTNYGITTRTSGYLESIKETWLDNVYARVVNLDKSAVDLDVEVAKILKVATEQLFKNIGVKGLGEFLYAKQTAKSKTNINLANINAVSAEAQQFIIKSAEKENQIDAALAARNLTLLLYAFNKVNTTLLTPMMYITRDTHALIAPVYFTKQVESFPVDIQNKLEYLYAGSEILYNNIRLLVYEATNKTMLQNLKKLESLPEDSQFHEFLTTFDGQTFIDTLKKLPDIVQNIQDFIAMLKQTAEILYKQEITSLDTTSSAPDTVVIANKVKEGFMGKKIQRNATRFNLFSEYDLSGGAWEKRGDKIVRKRPLDIKEAVVNGGAWSYREGDKILIDTGDSLLQEAMIVDRRDGVKYGIVITGSSLVHEIDEAEIIDAAEELF